MKIVSMSEAIALSLKTYFTGKRCPHGHTAERWTSTRECCECAKIRSRERARAHSEEHRARAKAAYHADPQKNIAKVKQWRSANPDRVAIYRKISNVRSKQRRMTDPEWREKQNSRARTFRAINPEKGRNQTNRWRSKNRTHVAAREANRRAKLKRAEGHHTKDDIARIRKAQRDQCAMTNCRRKLKGKGRVDHIVPLSKGGSNWPRNLQLLCRNCNSRKHSKDPTDHARSLGLLI